MSDLTAQLFWERDFYAAQFVASAWNHAPRGHELRYRARAVIVADRAAKLLFDSRMNDILKLLTTAPETQTTPEIRKQIVIWTDSVLRGDEVKAVDIVRSIDMLGGCSRQVRHLVTAYFQEALTRELKTEEKVREEADVRPRTDPVIHFKPRTSYETRPDCR